MQCLTQIHNDTNILDSNIQRSVFLAAGSVLGLYLGKIWVCFRSVILIGNSVTPLSLHLQFGDTPNVFVFPPHGYVDQEHSQVVQSILARFSTCYRLAPQPGSAFTVQQMSHEQRQNIADMFSLGFYTIYSAYQSKGRIA